MSRTPPSHDYDVGYADGRRDAGSIVPDADAATRQRSAGDERYDSGYVAGYLDWQDDEQQIEFPLFRRVGRWIAARFALASSAPDVAG
jgi:hypothetical protein